MHSIDRLARNLAELQILVDDLVARGVAVRFHKENLAFAGGTDPLNKLMLQMMGAFAQFERALIRERQREGSEAARKAGKPMGRPRRLSDEQITALRERAWAGEAKATLAREFRISRTTLSEALAVAG